MVEYALKLFDEMQLNDVVPNSIIYSTFMDGLCKNGLVWEALEAFNPMRGCKSKLSVETCNCLIDGLCKARRLEIAWEL